ncbi:small ribosomal subunit protein uS12-like [Styela clava]|uniref:28S ribosomal protein S12, mitochondrial-like n=1 Tax=Styela clava TaxID=7725 RepID=UPI001939AE7D|nr:28S ribosomal protein S12, mitochondrial-like [Styela clava]
MAFKNLIRLKNTLLTGCLHQVNNTCLTNTYNGLLVNQSQAVLTTFLTQPSKDFHSSAIDFKWEGRYRNFYHADLYMKTGKMLDIIAKKKKKSRMDGKPQIKGVVLRLLIKKPKKPNSANRKCCKVRLSTGKEIIAYIPGEGHNLQENNVVLIEGKGRKDLVGVHHKVIRGALDCAHVVKKEQD